MDTYKVESKRELIQIEIDGKQIEKVLKPFKNEKLIVLQKIFEKAKKVENLNGQINPKTKKQYTDEELNELADKYDKQSKDMMFKDCFTPPFTDEELNKIETPDLLEIAERVLIINGLEKMISFQQRVKEGQTSSGKTSPKELVNMLNQNPRQKLM